MISPWFEEIFGFKEKTILVQRYLRYDRSSGRLTSKKSEQEFAAGHFRTPSLLELQSRVDLRRARESLGDQPLAVREVVGDVSELHTRKENRFAVFQAASQFNALEFPSPEGLPEWGITCYAGDPTQGPACAIPCAPGTVVRNYFAFEDEGVSLPQTQDRQIQNLSAVERLLENDKNGFFRVRNGCTMADDDGLQRLFAALEADPDLCKAVRSSLRIGVQEDTEVVCSDFGRSRYEGAPMEQIVTQAYCSAVSIAYSGADPKLWALFARLILEAAYEATLYVAVENAMRNPDASGSTKVFLTALGGGVFGNDMQWIVDAMAKAFKKFEHVGLEVFLVSFGGPTREFARFLAMDKPNPL